jgi:hypothetical protein
MHMDVEPQSKTRVSTLIVEKTRKRTISVKPDKEEIIVLLTSGNERGEQQAED